MHSKRTLRAIRELDLFLEQDLHQDSGSVCMDHAPIGEGGGVYKTGTDVGWPQLDDTEFMRRYPRIDDVAAFLHGASSSSYRASGGYGPFDELGVNNVKEYLELVEKGDERAVELFEKMKKILVL